jgi:flap endonuclease-1
MGVNLRDIVPQRPIDFQGVSGRTIAVDALNTIYQFLASIRQPDGTPLMDAKGNVTSHLSGLLYRTTNLVRMGIRPIYVFDGRPPELKYKTLKARSERKREAQEEWDKARQEGRLQDAMKYAKRTSRLTEDMLQDARKLLTFMGIPHLQAPSEGEAQCASMVLKGDAWAVSSQDYDSLLFGAPRLVRGLTLSGKMELGIIDLQEALGALGISREQLIDLAILVGTDFDPGVHGIGPKKALKAVKEGKVASIPVEFDFDEVREVFLRHPVTDDYDLASGGVDAKGLLEFLSEEHGFSDERVRRAAAELEAAYRANSQQTLSKWF